MINPVTHPLYKDLEILRKICLQIIRDEGLNIYGENSKEIYGILFDVVWLWEAYLNYLIKKVTDRPFKHFIPGERGIKVFKGENIKFYPDFFSEERKNVLDAKYKFWSETKNFDDIHQLLAYMHVTGSNTGGVIFPTNDKSTDEIPRLEINTPFGRKEFVKLSFSIPKPEEIEYFALMKEEENNLIKKINRL